MNNKGIILILIGIGILLIALFFSSGYSSKQGFLSSVSEMEIVFVEGEYIRGSIYYNSYETIPPGTPEAS